MITREFLLWLNEDIADWAYGNFSSDFKECGICDARLLNAAVLIMHLNDEHLLPFLEIAEEVERMELDLPIPLLKSSR